MLDETVVKVNGEQFWLVVAVDSDTNVILHVRLYPVRNTALTKLFFRELEEKHAFDDAEFFVDSAHWLYAGYFELGIYVRHETFGERNSVECIF